MWVARIFISFLLSLVISVSAKLDSLKCTCTQDELDCSFRMKTVILQSELNQCSVTKWNFRGNYLRNFPRRSISRLDVSMNEFGLVLNSSLDIIYFTEIDVSSNYVKSPDFIRNSKPYSCRLSVLNISNNEISDLENIAKGCPLQIFRIANNKITQLNNNSFSQSLNFLDLSGNPLRSVSPAAFDGLRNLETLYLSDTRRLSELANETFSACLGLRHLYLSGNKLTNLPSGIFESLKNLETLHLQRNGMEQLPSGIFDKLILLRVLNLDSNALQELPDHLFRRLHSLEQLSVRGNHLTTLPSLYLCSGPLRIVIFSENNISVVNESAVRALWRPGFEVGDLGNNPIHEETFAWAQSASDVLFSGRDYDEHYIIRLKVEDRGVITDCTNCSLNPYSGIETVYGPMFG